MIQLILSDVYYISYFYRIFSIDITNILFDNSVSDSTHNTVVYDNTNKNQIFNNSSITQRSLSDICVAFK